MSYPPPYPPLVQVSYRKIVFTMGLWTPVYRMARRGRRTVTRTG